MARHRGFLEVRGISRESSTNLTHAGWGMMTPLSGCPLSTLSSRHSLSFSNPESTEGLHSSGISSADSWAQDDEFDRNATRRVRTMFEELEVALFEKGNIAGIPRNMERECSEWTDMFPHYRILGKQVMIPKEDGTEFICTDSDLSKQQIDTILDRSLSLHCYPPVQELEQSPDLTFLIEGRKVEQTESQVQEEIFAIEGQNEEYLAYDKPETFSSVAQVYYKYHQKPGFPPITPKSHRRHTIHSIVFERLWNHCINTSEPLITKICNGMLPDILSRRSLDRPALISASPLVSRGLQDVMTIRRVPLQERSSSQQTELPVAQLNRPHSSRLTTVKSVSGLGSLLPLRQKSRENLPPVDRTKILTFQSPIFNTSSTEGTVATAGLRGRQLRHQPRRLPPLTSDNVHENSEHFNPRVAGRNGESRAASAQPEESRRHIRTYYTPDGRPNTTSTFRVQTALTRRPPSTTPGRSKYQSVAPMGLEIFGASTGTTVTSKGSRLAVVEPGARLVEHDPGFSEVTSPTKTPTITENVFTKPGPVWITGVQGAGLRKSSNVR